MSHLVSRRPRRPRCPAVRALASLALGAALVAGSGITQVAVGSTVRPAGTTGAVAARVAYTSIASSYDTRVLALTNAARRQHGLAPLRAQSCVDGFASSWARYLAGHDAFRHQSLTPILRRCDRHRAGENIAWGSGYLSPEDVVDLWMHSPGHRANILDGRFRYLGVDAYRSAASGRTYVVQDFAG
ncbi:MAG: hypothetical protein JWR42_2631 [Marmoricola sp.]|nr:hypothetical protein [Marmoricola sp.]